MEPPSTAPLVLDYHRPRASAPAWLWMALLPGALPFLIEVIAIFAEATTGDPPNNLAEFKAYHYWTGAAVLIGLAWFACTFFAFRRRCRWMLLISGGWCLWVCWVAYWFLRSLHEHPAGAYYRSLW